MFCEAKIIKIHAVIPAAGLHTESNRFFALVCVLCTECIKRTDAVQIITDKVRYPGDVHYKPSSGFNFTLQWPNMKSNSNFVFFLGYGSSWGEGVEGRYRTCNVDITKFLKFYLKCFLVFCTCNDIQGQIIMAGCVVCVV
jgi:hypothetical protein